MPPDRILLLHNPAAGKRRGACDALLATSIATVPTPAPGETDDDVLARLRDLDADADVLGIAGGDGTLHYAANALARARGATASWPRLALLPAGSANDGARAIEALRGRPLPRSADAWLADVRRALAAGDAGTPADLGRVTIEGAPPLLFANFAAVGSPADWAELSAARWLRPLKRLSVGLAYGLCNLIVIARARRLALACGLDGGPTTSAEVFAWFAANARWLGGGLDLGPDVALDSGRLAILTVPPGPRLALIRLLRAVARGAGPPTTSAHTAVLRLAAGTCLNLDGEILAPPAAAGTFEATFDVLPQRARWL